jgi:hypothetical protein
MMYSNVQVNSTIASGISSFVDQPRVSMLFSISADSGMSFMTPLMISTNTGNALHTQPAQNMPLEGGVDAVPELMTVSFAIWDALYQLSRMI